jgi:hypothetical protein
LCGCDHKRSGATTSDGAVAIGHSRYYGRGDQADRLVDGGLGVREHGPVRDRDLFAPQHPVDLVLDIALDLGLLGQVRQELDQEVCDGGVASNDVLQGEKRRVPCQLGGLLALHVLDQAVDVVVGVGVGVEVVEAAPDDVGQDEVADLVRGFVDPFEVLLVEGHQEREEVGGVTLVDLVEDVVVVVHHLDEGLVAEVEAFGAEVSREDVCANARDDRLGRKGTQSYRLRDGLSTRGDELFQRVKPVGEGSGEGVGFEHVASRLLRGGPIAES